MSIFERAKAKWNEEADEFNQWTELDWEEKRDLMNQQPLIAGDNVYFFKSGNRVKIIETINMEQFQAERIDGQSTGKRMICNATALGWCIPGNEMETVEAFEYGDIN